MVVEEEGRGLGRGWILMPAREGGGVRRGLKDDMARRVRQRVRLVVMSGDVGREEDDELVGGRRDRQDGVVDMPLWRRRSRVDVMVGPLFFAVGGARRCTKARRSVRSPMTALLRRFRVE